MNKRDKDDAPLNDEEEKLFGLIEDALWLDDPKLAAKFSRIPLRYRIRKPWAEDWFEDHFRKNEFGRSPASTRPFKTLFKIAGVLLGITVVTIVAAIGVTVTIAAIF